MQFSLPFLMEIQPRAELGKYFIKTHTHTHTEIMKCCHLVSRRKHTEKCLFYCTVLFVMVSVAIPYLEAAHEHI